MIVWNCQKVIAYNSALNLSRGFPICQNNRNFGTFWYLKLLGPLSILENVKDMICDFTKLKEIKGKILSDTRLSPPNTLRHLLCTQRYPQTRPDTPTSPLTNPEQWTFPTPAIDTHTLNRHNLRPQFYPRVPHDIPWQPKSLLDCLTSAWEMRVKGMYLS